MTLPKTRRCECDRLGEIVCLLQSQPYRGSYLAHVAAAAAGRQSLRSGVLVPVDVISSTGLEGLESDETVGPDALLPRCAVCSVIVQGRNRDIEPRRFAAAMTVDSAILPSDARNLIS